MTHTHNNDDNMCSKQEPSHVHSINIPGSWLPCLGSYVQEGVIKHSEWTFERLGAYFITKASDTEILGISLENCTFYFMANLDLDGFRVSAWIDYRDVPPGD